MADLHGEGGAQPDMASNSLFDEGGALSDPLERIAVFSALDSFSQYRKSTHHRTTHIRRQNLYAMPAAQWQVLAAPPISILETLSNVDDAIDVNADLADRILQHGLVSFGLSDRHSNNPDLDWQHKATINDLPKAHSTIRQFYRDWSREGYIAEVEPLVDIVVSDLSTHLPLPQPREDIESPRLLLPGAGLGRVLFELALRGWHATGNEISYHQLIASNFILNATQHSEQYTIYPFATTFTNVISRQNQLKHFAIPDRHPGRALEARDNAALLIGEMHMTAGDFMLGYSTPCVENKFDGVVSVFFIDTAPNLIRYIQTVHNCLRKGGVWINIGPLLWHFDGRDNRDRNDEINSGGEKVPGQEGSDSNSVWEDKGVSEPGSFELTDEEVLQLVPQFGFEIVKHEIINRPHGSDEGFGYMQDASSLLQSRYRCSHWVARKI
ncbi:hypothetical protein LTR84_006841 [Exophiala bonariae]|uniref:carnosine N-methyltransferase n=1 Tax=Exophiala bonariae TaxID=1690606 RepID=A0AAV9N023_9EURO|nr:hypothetical protein LTR84_006841 [Exophiala bonariae]